LGGIIEDRREELGLTKAQAARIAGLSRSTWHEVETGQRTQTLADTLNLFDKALRYPRGTLRRVEREGPDILAEIGLEHVIVDVKQPERPPGDDPATLLRELMQHAALLTSDGLKEVLRFIRAGHIDVDPVVAAQIEKLRTEFDRQTAEMRALRELLDPKEHANGAERSTGRDPQRTAPTEPETEHSDPTPLHPRAPRQRGGAEKKRAAAGVPAGGARVKGRTHRPVGA